MNRIAQEARLGFDGLLNQYMQIVSRCRQLSIKHQLV
jgi:hypothetical protein